MGRVHSHFEGHTEWITSGVLLSDHATLVTASLDTTIKVWNLRSGTGSSSNNSNNSITARATSSAAASASTAHVPPTSSACLATLCKHGDYIQSLSYCRWNQLMVSAGLNFELYSWRMDAPGAPKLVDNLSGGGGGGGDDSSGGSGSATPTQQEYGVHEFDQLRGSFYATSLSENGNTLLTGSSDQIVRLYDTRCMPSSSSSSAGGRTPARNWLKLLGHTDTIRAVHLSESVGSGLSMAYTGSSDGSIKEWDLRVQRCVGSIEPGGGGDCNGAAAARSAGGGLKRARPAASPSLIPYDRMCDVREKLLFQQQNLTPSRKTLAHVLQPQLHPPLPPAAAPAGAQAVWTMQLSADCTKVFSGGAGPTIWVSTFATGHSEPLVQFRPNPFHRGGCGSSSSSSTCSTTKLQLDEERGTLWAGTWDGLVTGWNVKHCLRAATKNGTSRTRRESKNQPPPAAASSFPAPNFLTTPSPVTAHQGGGNSGSNSASASRAASRGGGRGRERQQR